MKCNIYDFDETIYDGDSAIDFYKFCFKKNPLMIGYLPIFIWYVILYLLHCTTKEKLKEKFYLYLNDFDDIDSIVDEFWQSHEKNIKKFYSEIRTDDDIVISASPTFLLKSICKKLKIKKLIASDVDKETGEYLDKNCYGEEKVNQFNKQFKKYEVENVYSDSYSDRPIFKLGKKAYLVKKDKLILLSSEQVEKGKNNSIFYKLFKKIFIISVPFMTTLVCGNYNVDYYRLLMILSFLCGFYIYKKFIKQRQQQDINKGYLIFSLIFSLYGLSLISTYKSTMTAHLGQAIINSTGLIINSKNILFMVCLLALPAIIYIVYLLVEKIFPFIKKEYKELTNPEKAILVIVGILSIIIVSIIYSRTDAFYTPSVQGKVRPYDIIYTTDSGYLNGFSCYSNIGCAENDIRQPLFGLFAMPFSIIASLLSKLLLFIPSAYYTIFTVIQIILLTISFIFISKMLKLSTKKEIGLLMIFFVSYPFIAFSLIYEQYIIGFFYLILTIYMHLYHKSEVNYSYIGATGTLLTSGIILPTITSSTNIKKIIKNVFKCFIWFVIVMILSGQILLIFSSLDKIKDLLNHYGVVITFSEKLKQYLYFVQNIFIAPNSLQILDNYSYRFTLYGTSNYSIVGIIILILCFISLIINRKNKFAVTSFLWIIFSFILLCVVGWGTQEYGLILYSLYFFWAFIILIYLLINKIKNKKVRVILILILLVIMIFFNYKEFFKLLKFCFTRYGIE